MKRLVLYWFKIQASIVARKILIHHYSNRETKEILNEYWQKYVLLKKSIPEMPTVGGSIMVHLAAMSRAFYMELLERGKQKEEATQLFFDVAWKIYLKMGRLSWWLAGIGKKDQYQKLLKATQLFRAFLFSSPSYVWQDGSTENNVVGFDCIKCPVAEYFGKHDLSEFCAATWCALDYPLAELWHAELKRTGSIAGGAVKCDFRWISTNSKLSNQVSLTTDLK